MNSPLHPSNLRARDDNIISPMCKNVNKVGKIANKVEIKKAPLRGKGFRTSLFYHKSKNLSIEGEEKMKQLSAKVTSTSNWLTDEEVEREIERLNASEAVALARREQRLKYKRRQHLYNLRDLEKKGKALLAAGITREVLDALYKNNDEEE